MIGKPLVTQHEPFVAVPKLSTGLFTDDFLAEPFQLKLTQACPGNYNLSFATKLAAKSLTPQTKIYFPARVLGEGYNLWLKVADKQMKFNLQFPTINADQLTMNAYLAFAPSKKLDNIKLAACLSAMRNYSSGIVQLDIRPKFNSNGFSIAHRVLAKHKHWNWVLAFSGAHDHSLKSLKEQILIGHQTQSRDFILKTEQAWLGKDENRSLHNIYDQVVLDLILKKPDYKLGLQAKLGVVSKHVDFTALLECKLPKVQTCIAKAKLSLSKKIAVSIKKRVDKEKSLTVSGEYDAKSGDSNLGLQLDLSV